MFSVSWLYLMAIDVFVNILVYLYHFGLLCQEESSNPAAAFDYGILISSKDFVASSFDDSVSVSHQGDQIGTIFPHWMTGF
jgi:hypothetical protein